MRSSLSTSSGSIEQYAGRIDDATRSFEEVAHPAADVGAVERRARAIPSRLARLPAGRCRARHALERDSSVALEELGAYYVLAHNLRLRAVPYTAATSR